jgi:hypothetical protein
MIKEDWRKFVNTIMLSIITISLSVGLPLMFDAVKDFSEKLDNLLITVTVHNSESELWKNQITKNTELIQLLMNGQHKATSDRITKAEVIQAINNQDKKMREWVERYFEHKK